MIKILVLGITGFIGSNLGEHLIKSDAKIIGIDNFDPFNPTFSFEDDIKEFVKWFRNNSL